MGDFKIVVAVLNEESEPKMYIFVLALPCKMGLDAKIRQWKRFTGSRELFWPFFSITRQNTRARTHANTKEAAPPARQPRTSHPAPSRRHEDRLHPYVAASVSLHSVCASMRTRSCSLLSLSLCERLCGSQRLELLRQAENGGEPVILSAAYEVSSFGYFQRSGCVCSLLVSVTCSSCAVTVQWS